MPRKPRPQIPGTYHHVILRGNGGNQIFFCDEDRYRFYYLLQEGCERFKHRIHSFCLMSNHVHLAIQLADISLSKIIQNVSFRYTQYINRKFHRIGHLFQGRFKSIPIDSESYLTTLVRYIHLNPVRAGIVQDPREYKWSSHHTYLGNAIIPWVTTQSVLEKLECSTTSSIQTYENFILNEIDDILEEKNKFEKGIAKGVVTDDQFFLNKLINKPSIKPTQKISLPQLVDRVCQYFSIHPSELSQQTKNRQHSLIRSIIIYLATKNNNITMSETAIFFKRDLSSTSKQLHRFNKKIQQDSSLKMILEILEKLI